MTMDLTGENTGNIVVPEGWYNVEVIMMPQVRVGKNSGKKYVAWPGLKILEGKYEGIYLSINTTLEKGNDPLRSKRWLFHQAMAGCGIKKVNNKYELDIIKEKNPETGEEEIYLKLLEKTFWVKVTIKQDIWQGEPIEKNEIKRIAIEPPKSLGELPAMPVTVKSDGNSNKLILGDDSLVDPKGMFQSVSASDDLLMPEDDGVEF